MPTDALKSRAGAIAAGAAVLLLLVVVARGCGEDRLSAAELRTQASAICVDALAATDSVAVPSTAADGARFLAEGIAYLRPAVHDLRALKAPDELRDRYERAVARDAEAVALVVRYERQIRQEGEVIAGFRALQRELEPLIRDGNELWRALEIPACVLR